MTDFTKKQIKILKGNYRAIARACDCTPEYVVKVLAGKVGSRRGGPKADAVKEKARQLLNILEPNK